MKNETLDLFKFDYVGKYIRNTDGTISCEYIVKKTERVSLVYAVTVDDVIMYFGKTIQGYSRPLTYHKNGVMKRVKSGIEDSLQKSKEVSVYARRFEEGDLIEWEGLKLSVFDSVERALIDLVNPKWNAQ